MEKAEEEPVWVGEDRLGGGGGGHRDQSMEELTWMVGGRVWAAVDGWVGVARCLCGMRANVRGWGRGHHETVGRLWVVQKGLEKGIKFIMY